MKTKELWIEIFETALQKLPKIERKKAVDYYREMIEDKIEGGIIEEEVVASLGNPYDVAKKILDENGIKYKDKDLFGEEPIEVVEIKEEKEEKKGMPIWATLLLGFFGVIIGIPLLAGWLGVLVALIAVYVSLIAGAVACGVLVFASIIMGLCSIVESGWALFGASLAGLGVTLLLSVVFWALSKGMVKATAWLGKKLVNRGEKK